MLNVGKVERWALKVEGWVLNVERWALKVEGWVLNVER